MAGGLILPRDGPHLAPGPHVPLAGTACIPMAGVTQADLSSYL